jgi:hypothetical protein
MLFLALATAGHPTPEAESSAEQAKGKGRILGKSSKSIPRRTISLRENSFVRPRAPGLDSRIGLCLRGAQIRIAPWSDTLVLRTLPPLPRIHQERSLSGSSASP